MSVRCEVLKELVTSYKAEEGEKKERLFEIILARVDKLLIQKALMMKAIHKQLEHIDEQELYQSAVIGLYRAIKSAKPHDSGDTIQARIISYVKEEIRKTYLGRKRSMLTIDPTSIVGILSDEHTEDPRRIEENEIISIIKRMIKDGEIRESDWRMLVDSAVNGLTYREIGRRSGGLHYTTVSRRIKNIRLTIMERLGELEDQ